MAKKGDARSLVNLGCERCRERTYHTSKNKRNDPQRLELNRYCPRCRVHTLHKEVR
ncbi:MAG: 50S ribosomal protein L33 [Chloroflexota bacterium]|jgi:large subunit ribosomal protein L33